MTTPPRFSVITTRTRSSAPNAGKTANKIGHRIRPASRRAHPNRNPLRPKAFSRNSSGNESPINRCASAIRPRAAAKKDKTYSGPGNISRHKSLSTRSCNNRSNVSKSGTAPNQCPAASASVARATSGFTSSTSPNHSNTSNSALRNVR